jgi:methylglutaconyl-CoA hydratase
MSITIKENSKYFVEILLNRPSVRNAFDPEMIEKITQVFQKLSSENHLRAIILRGEGKVFCAGADLKWMESMVNYTLSENEEDAERLFKMFEVIEQCPHPVLSIVHGAAMGGAIGLLAASDIVIAEKTTQFCFSEVKLGIAPAVISAFVLKNRPAAFISPWMMSGRIFSSEVALQMGLVTEIYESQNANERESILESWKTSFIESAPQAVKSTKNLIKKIVNQPWLIQKNITTKLIAERRVSDEGQEGLKSFLNKTTPHWRKS